MRRLLTTGLALVLSACGGGEVPADNVAAPTPTPTPGPSLAGVPLDEPIRAGGSAPFWEIYLAPGTITFADAHAHPVDFYPTSPAIESDGAMVRTQTIAGEPVTLALSTGPCVSGAESLPLTAEARIGARTLRGCAGPTERRPSSPPTATPSPDPATR